MANGEPVTYTLGLAAPLVTVLAQARADNATTYLYGRGDSPLASEDGSPWRYLTEWDTYPRSAAEWDTYPRSAAEWGALNSVRQETDATGQVVADQVVWS